MTGGHARHLVVVDGRRGLDLRRMDLDTSGSDCYVSLRMTTLVRLDSKYAPF